MVGFRVANATAARSGPSQGLVRLLRRTGPIQKLAVGVMKGSQPFGVEMPRSKEEQRTIAFLKMATIELRRIADRAPEVAADLRHVVQQVETEIADMEQRGSDE